MKALVPAIAAGLLFSPGAQALPNSILGPVLFAESPLNGVDLTRELTSPELWEGKAELPGEWKEEGEVGAATVSHLLARPKLFGRDVVLLRAVRREGALESLDVTFVDAGSFFGYFDEELPEGMSRRQMRGEMQARLAAKQTEFSELYQETHAALRNGIAGVFGGGAETVKVGRTRGLRAEPEMWRKGGLAARMLTGPDRLIRVSLGKAEAMGDDWFDPSYAKETPRDRLARLAAGVRREENGTVHLPGVRPIPQGYRPYCGLNTLAMAARHFGMHLDEDWLACAGGFRNTGSADGSNMVKLYHSLAAEAGLGMDRANRFDAGNARRALDKGLPVIVWRRFSHERNQLHSRFMRDFGRNPVATLPDPALKEEKASWPGADAPLHASVLVGYHAGRREFLFLESWTGRDTPRRMREEEMAATAYLTFVFKP